MSYLLSELSSASLLTQRKAKILTQGSHGLIEGAALTFLPVFIQLHDT